MKYSIGILIIFLSLNFLGGCTVALVGGSAVGGYLVGKDERKVGRIVEDSVITAEINAIFLSDDIVETFKINVDTYRGVVTLTGTLPDKGMIDHAIALVKEVEGVQEINSLLVTEA